MGLLTNQETFQQGEEGIFIINSNNAGLQPA